MKQKKEEMGMSRKRFTQKLAWALVAAMLMTSTGITALAEATTAAGELEGSYQLVNLHMDRGEFQAPMSFGELPKEDDDPASPSDADKATDSDADKATDSNADGATTSDASSSVDTEDDESYDGEIVLDNDLTGNGLIQGKEASKVTTLAVTDGVLTEEDIENALYEADYKLPGAEEADWDIYSRYWLTKEGDPDSAVDLSDGLELFGDVTDLYAMTFMYAAGDVWDEYEMEVLSAGLTDDVFLRAGKVKENNAWTEEGMAEDLAGSRYINFDLPSAVQLEVRLKGINESDSGADIAAQDAVVTVTMNDALSNAWQEGRSFVVVYYNSKGERILMDPELVNLKPNDMVYDDPLLQFTLKGLTNKKAFVAIVPVDKMIEVTLENVANGAGIVYKEEYDWDAETYKFIYLPVGETVMVPKNTEFQLYGQSYYGKNKDYSVEYFQIAEDGKDPVSYDVGEYYILKAEDKAVLTPVVKEDINEGSERSYQIVLHEDGDFTGSNKASGELKLHIRNEETGKWEKVNATDWKFWDEDALNEQMLNDWELERLANDLFTLSSNGNLSSKEVLPSGEYNVYVTCMYNGEQYGLRLKDRIWIYAGVSVNFGTYLGQFDSSVSEDDLIYDPIANSGYYNQGVLFGKVKEETKENWLPEVAMFGYEFAGWFQDAKESQELKDDTAIENDYTLALAMFKDAEGNLYKASIKTDDSAKPDTPVTPVNPNKPGGNSGSGGSGGSGGRSFATSSSNGSWIRDTIGWWYKLNDGTYPAGKWMQLLWNGKTSWYYFHANGYMATGWLQIDGLTYYLHPLSDGTQGYMYTGWHQIDGKWYYFSEISDGTMGHLLIIPRPRMVIR